MPIIPDEATAGAANILKPKPMNLKIGTSIKSIIVQPHNVSADGLYSVPVNVNGKIEGDFPLNKTHLRMIVDKLGADSDKWVGAKFSAMVVPQNNPQSKEQVLSWAIDVDSIEKPKGA